MNKKQKTSKKRDVKSPVLTWREQLASMNQNAVGNGRRVELSMLIEYFPKYLHLTQELQSFTYSHPTLNTQCIIYEEILYIIKHYPAWKRSYLDANVEAILEQAIEEAKPFLKERAPIPLELMAQLIKLRVIMAAQRHASNETPVSSLASSESSSDEDTISLHERSLMIQHFFGEDTTVPSESNDEDVFGNVPEIDELFFAGSSKELRGYIKALKVKREEFMKRSSEEKPEVLIQEVIRSISREIHRVKPPWRLRKHALYSDARENEVNLNMILTGFYDAALIYELAKIGLPMACVIAFGEDREPPARPEFPQKIYSLENMDTTQNRHVPIYHYSLHSANQRLKNFLYTTYYKELILRHCYETLEDLFETDPTLRDVLYFRCDPTVDQGEEIYSRVTKLLREIPRIRTLHGKYLKKIRLRHLGESPGLIPVSRMARYNASLSKVPSECVSISLVLDGLLEEVCQQVETKIAKTYRFKRDQNNTLQKLDLSTYVINEKNVLEMSLRYYPQIKERLLAVNLAYLGMSKPALLWQRYPKLRNLDKSQYLTWASSLRLSQDDLDTCLQVYMCKLLVCSKTIQSAAVAADEDKTPYLRWQEDLSRKTMLQEVWKASVTYTCTDHIYVPLMDVILLRFHDNSNDFGLSTKTWSEMLHTPVGLHDFHKWVLHQHENHGTSNLTGYDFDKWQGTEGVSTLFRSCEGFSVRVDKEWRCKRAPQLSIQFEASGHSLHLNSLAENAGFTFHFLLANGCRILFAKPTPAPLGRSFKSHRRSLRKIKRPTPVCYLVEKTSCVHFADRQRCPSKTRLLTQASLREVLCRSSTISELDSLESIVLKPKRSTTTIFKTPRRRMCVFKRIEALKATVRPKFKICSSILHKFKYVKVDRERLTVDFVGFTATIKFIPRAKLNYQIKISPCFYLPPQDDEAQTLNAVYDIRVSLPSGLQVQTRQSPNGSCHIFQYYASGKGPTCKNEVSRTYLRNGFVCVKYVDGSLKMLSAHGVGATCEAPFFDGVRHKTRRRKLLERYQSKFVGDHHKNYLRRWKRRCDPDWLELYGKINRSVELVTGDGRKFLVSKGGRVVIRTGHKIRPTSSTNQNGELTTVYPDGTRITSWYRIEQEMVVLPGDPLVGELELDEDDYLCNFLIPRRGGWISVQLYYQFEHPNYATVVYGGGDENFMQLRLPNGTELRTQRNGYSLSVKEQIFADVFAANIILHSNFCRKCYDSCAVKFNVKHLYDNSKLPPPDKSLLVAKDNFGKVFRVTHDGKCYMNDDYKAGKVKHDCLTHRKDESEKFYVWHRDLSGKALWNPDMYLNRMMIAQYGKMQRVKYYLGSDGGLLAYEFLKYVRRHYCHRFLMEYGAPDAPIFKPPKTHSDNPFKAIAFIKRRFIKVIPDCDKTPLSRDEVADGVQAPYDAEGFAKWVDGIQDGVVFDDKCRISRVFPTSTEMREKSCYSETDTIVPVAPTNSLVSPSNVRSETDQINLVASTLLPALLAQDDFLQQAPSVSNLSHEFGISKPKARHKDESARSTTRYDLSLDAWTPVSSGKSLPTQKDVNAQPRGELRRKEFAWKQPTRIAAPIPKTKTKATSTVTLETSCKCRRSLRDLIRESPQITGEFVRKRKPLIYKQVIKCNQKFYKQLECKLLDTKSFARKLSHLRRDSTQSIVSQELQSTLPLVLPASTSEDSCKVLLAPKSAIVTKREKKLAKPFRPNPTLTIRPLPSEEEESRDDDRLLEEQAGKLTPQSLNVFLKMLRQRLRKIEDVDDSEIVRKIGERFDDLIREDEVPFPKKILMLQASLKLLRRKREDVESAQSSVKNIMI